MRGLKRFLLSAPVCFILLNTPSLADERECSGFDDLSPQADVALATVTAKRVHIIKGSLEDESCPSASLSCRESVYLVKGNEVIIGRELNGFVCATYLGPRRRMSLGWLPANSVSRKPPDRSRKVEDWLGKWRFRVDAPRYRAGLITITKAASSRDALHIDGNAGYAHDYAAALRGSVNVGEILADVGPAGAALAFTQGDDGMALPYDHPGDEWSCRIQIRLLGPYLLVNDNWKCGGNNVTFWGVYRRER